MSFQISRRDVDSAYAYANKSMRRLRDPEEHGSGVLDRALQTGEVVGSAAVVGVLAGRFGNLDYKAGPVTVPMDLAGGVAGHLLAFWLDGPASKHLHNVSNGVLAAFGMRLGMGAGIKLRSSAGLSTSGDPYQAFQPGEMSMLNAPRFDQQYDIVGGAASAAPLTEAELAALAQQVR